MNANTACATHARSPCACPSTSLSSPHRARPIDASVTQDGEATVFHFEITPQGFRGALERFASQFVAPLCLEGATDREVQAVNSEANQRLQSDSVRQMQVLCHSAAEGHPYRKFSCGNIKSLVEDVKRAGGKTLREQLLQHHEEHYSAERMSLVLLGAEPLDTLAAWIEELFGPVPGGRGPRPSISAAGFPYPTGEPPVLHRIPAVREVHCVTVSFQLPPMDDLYESKPYSYVSHLIGHESGGSLLSALKEKGIASGLWAGVTWGGVYRSSAVWLFGVCITLTDAGLPRWAVRGGHTRPLSRPPALSRRAGRQSLIAGRPTPRAPAQEAVDMLFAYIAMVKAAGPQQWIHDEIAAIRVRAGPALAAQSGSVRVDSQRRPSRDS